MWLQRYSLNEGEQMLNIIRRNPALIFAAIAAIISTIVIELGALAPIWLTVVNAVVIAMGGVATYGMVTPVVAPYDNEGNQLVPNAAPDGHF